MKLIFFKYNITGLIFSFSNRKCFKPYNVWITGWRTAHGWFRRGVWGWEKQKKNKIKPTWTHGENEKYVMYHSWAGRNANLMTEVRDCLQDNFICLFYANLALAWHGHQDVTKVFDRYFHDLMNYPAVTWLADRISTWTCRYTGAPGDWLLLTWSTEKIHFISINTIRTFILSKDIDD